MLVKKSAAFSLVSSQIVIVRETSLVSTFHSQKQHFSHRNRAAFELSLPPFSLLARGAAAGLQLTPPRSQPFGLVSQHRDPSWPARHFLRPFSHTVLPMWATFFTSVQFSQRPAHNSSLTARQNIRYFFNPLLKMRLYTFTLAHKTMSWNYSHKKIYGLVSVWDTWEFYWSLSIKERERNLLAQPD